MKGYIIETEKPLPEEFIALSKAVGWGTTRTYDLKKVEEALTSTAFIVTVRKDGILVGCGRAFSDDLLFTTVPDLFVHPEHQKQGLGKAMMELIKKRFKHTTIFFGSRPGNERFFEKLGFEKGMQSYTLRPK